MAIAALVLGILAIVLSWLPLVGLVLAVVAIVLAVVARKKLKSGLSTAGLVLGIIGCVFGGVALAMTGALTKLTSDHNKELQALVEAQQRAHQEAEANTDAIRSQQAPAAATKKVVPASKSDTNDPLGGLGL